MMGESFGLDPLLRAFTAEAREGLYRWMERYDQLLAKLMDQPAASSDRGPRVGGIRALNGASGAGQSYVLERVEGLLRERSIKLPRMYLLGTRPPRPGEGHKNPYIFVEKTESGYQDIHHPQVVYSQEDIYYSYESRPGAGNAILLADVHAAMDTAMYLETVIPTLLHMRSTRIADVPAWGDKLKIVYLATPSGQQWLHRLLNREPAKLTREEFRRSILGRVESSLADMEQAAQHGVPTVLNRHQQGERAAQEILALWGF